MPAHLLALALDGASFVALNGASFNHKPAAVGHGVVRIDRQVHQHLVELDGIRRDREQRIVQHDAEIDVVAEHRVAAYPSYRGRPR